MTDWYPVIANLYKPFQVSIPSKSGHSIHTSYPTHNLYNEST